MFPRLLRTSRRSSLFLFGARGTGKTTYIRDAFDPDASLYVDLLDPEVEDQYLPAPFRKCAAMAGLKMSSSSMVSSSNLH